MNIHLEKATNKPNTSVSFDPGIYDLKVYQSGIAKTNLTKDIFQPNVPEDL
jgi:hypothetical protein